MPDSKKLYRSKDHRMLAGVAAGLGEYFKIDPWVFRLAFIVLTFFSGIGVLVYLALWLIIPREPGWKMRPTM